jgi:hypothetical protein
METLWKWNRKVSIVFIWVLVTLHLYYVVNSVWFGWESALEQQLPNPWNIFVIQSEMCLIELTIFIALKFRRKNYIFMLSDCYISHIRLYWRVWGYTTIIITCHIVAQCKFMHIYEYIYIYISPGCWRARVHIDRYSRCFQIVIESMV